MLIAIDTRFLKPGHVGGSERYTRELIAALGRIDRQNEYHIAATRQNSSIFQALPSNFHLISEFENPLAIDLIHFPGTTIRPLSLNVPCVITVHDLQHLYWPGFFSFREKLRRWRRDRPSLYKADRIIAVSQFTGQTIGEKFPGLEQKITVIHSGVSADFFQPVPTEDQERLRQRYNLPDRFILYPARPWPHKNHKRLFEAMRLLKDHYGSDCRLVLSGFGRDERPSDWGALLDSLGDDTVRFVGYLSEHEMPVLNKMAECLVFPSLFEGFGLPVLEAMAAGVPVICSDMASLPEIAGDAAVMVDPFDAVSLAGMLFKILEDDGLRKKQIKRGIKQAQKFTWDTTAQATLKVFEGVLQ